MKIALIVGLGSFVGGVCRYMLGAWIQNRYSSIFPYGTLLINVLGCLLIGCIMGLALKGNTTNEWKFFLAAGVCGGFTTFSAFSWEILNLLKSGNTANAVIYIALSMALGLGAAFVGYALFKA